MQSTHLRDGDLHLMGLKKWRIAWSPIGLLPKLETMENNGKQWITIVKSEERIRKDLPSSSYTNDVYVCLRINKVLAYNVVHYIINVIQLKKSHHLFLHKDRQWIFWLSTNCTYVLQTFYLTSPFSSGIIE